MSLTKNLAVVVFMPTEGMVKVMSEQESWSMTRSAQKQLLSVF